MSRYIDKKNGEERQQKAYDYLINRGLQPHHAAGIVGNLMQESFKHLDSTIENSIGAVGIAQWLGPRKESLKTFAKDKGTSYKDFDTQLDFLYKELTTTGDSWGKKGQAAFFKAETAEEAAAMFVNKFERSGEKPGEKGYDNRLRNAKSVYLQFNDKALYGKNDKGQIVNINPEAATQEEIAMAPKIKAEFYESQFGIENERAEDKAPEPSTAAKEAEEGIAKKEVIKKEKDEFIAKLMTKDVSKKDIDELEKKYPEEAVPNPYDLDITTPGNEFFNFFLEEGN